MILETGGNRPWEVIRDPKQKCATDTLEESGVLIGDHGCGSNQDAMYKEDTKIMKNM